MKNVALVLSGLALGVLAGVAFVPRVFAQGPHGPQKWQQLCEPVASVHEANSVAGARGAEGWELVTSMPGALCFKRPMPTRRGEPGWPGY